MTDRASLASVPVKDHKKFPLVDFQLLNVSSCKIQEEGGGGGKEERFDCFEYLWGLRLYGQEVLSSLSRG